GRGKAKGGEGMRQALKIYKNRFPHIQGILIVPEKQTLMAPKSLIVLNVPYCSLYDKGINLVNDTANGAKFAEYRKQVSRSAITDYGLVRLDLHNAHP
ncbi:hypothetical protein MPER_09962, partial [Moniliophthora perniciosa FA553]